MPSPAPAPAAQSLDIEPIKPRSKHAPRTVDTALLAIAMTGGSDVAASKLLAEQGVNVGSSLLKAWRTRLYPNRYRDLCERYKADIEGEIVSSVRALALRASQVAQRALALEEQRIEAGETNDAASSLRNIATTIGISVDKVMLLEGRPTQITEQRSSDDVLRGLQAKGYIIDSTATAINDEDPAEAGSSPATG